ncbi:MAG: hypothetical protein IPI96_09795 [Saprospiraceae bacterium]|nr:hypothetical protein [Saprospiraceae bacterium]
MALENLVQMQDPEVFENSTAEHALIVFGTIFKNCNSKLKVFADRFTGRVSNQKFFLKSLEEFLLKEGSSLDIIFENEPNQDSLALKLINGFKGKVNTYRLNPKGFSHEYPNKPGYFLIGDGKMFRLQKLENQEKYNAFCSFNNPKIANSLENIFNILLKYSTPINNN